MTRHSGVGGPVDEAWRPPARVTPTDGHAAPTESLAGYDHLTEVGRGGDSVVYRARDTGMDRDVAIKVLQTDDERAVARFRREIAITVRLGRQHPNIVNILTTGTTASGRPAIVMDFYESGSLQDRLRTHGPLPVDEVVTIGTVLADALAFAHGHGVLHRDVKPQNVLVLPTSWVLADFGIARLVDAEHTSSAETFTYRHASPQILDGEPPTEADDVWSLGSTLYTLVDGRPPFASVDPDEDSALAYLRRARTEPHRPLEGRTVGGLAAVLERCLSKDPADRWGSAAELAEALSRLRVTAWEPGAEPGHTPSVTPLGAAPRASEPPPAPAPAVDPVALSVLAHAPASLADESPTGTRPPEAEPAPPAPPPPAAPAEEHSEEPRSRRRWLLIALGATAAVIGLVLGVTGAVLRGDDGEPDAQPPAADAGRPVDTLPSEPLQSGPAQAQRADPRLAFDLLGIRSDGTSVWLKWNDPTDGAGQFVVTQTRPEELPVYTFDPGTTEGTFPLVVRPGVRTCFVMSVHLPTDELGLSGTRCVTG